MPRMKRYRRAARRQGVVYGPPRAAGPNPEADAVARVLGPLVVIGAVGLLAIGSWAVLGRGGAPGASPTAVAVSPSPSPSPSNTATATLVLPTATATLPPSPSPTEFAIEVREGPGAITFGTEWDEDTLRVTDARTTFPPRGRFVWSAELTEAAGAPELQVTISSYDPDDGAETVIAQSVTEVENQSATLFLRRQPMQRLVDEPGIYVVRYFRGDILLAEGYFQVE